LWKMKIQVVPLSQQSSVQKHITPDSCDVSNNMLVSSVQKHCRLFLFVQNFIFSWMTLHLKIPIFKPPESSWHNFKDADNLNEHLQYSTMEFWHPLGCDSWFQPHSISKLFKTKMLRVAINVTYVNSVANTFLWTKLHVRSVYIIAVRERKCQLEGALRSRPCSL
jgi:hypothetical protein